MTAPETLLSLLPLVKLGLLLLSTLVIVVLVRAVMELDDGC